MIQPCDLCDGSGQISYFMGVSRFLLSWEECPRCGGMGFTFIEEKQNGSGKKKQQNSKQSKTQKGG